MHRTPLRGSGGPTQWLARSRCTPLRRDRAGRFYLPASVVVGTHGDPQKSVPSAGPRPARVASSFESRAHRPAAASSWHLGLLATARLRPGIDDRHRRKAHDCAAVSPRLKISPFGKRIVKASRPSAELSRDRNRLNLSGCAASSSAANRRLAGIGVYRRAGRARKACSRALARSWLALGRRPPAGWSRHRRDELDVPQAFPPHYCKLGFEPVGFARLLPTSGVRQRSAVIPIVWTNNIVI